MSEYTESVGGEPSGLSLTSDGLVPGQPVPRRFTCDGEDVSPAVSWEGAPPETETYVLILDDPDAPGGGYTHWIVFNIPVGVSSLPEALPQIERLFNSGVQGMNDSGGIGYHGPCPPPGRMHHYRLTLYALDTALDLDPGVPPQRILESMRGHILDKAELISPYQRAP